MIPEWFTTMPRRTRSRTSLRRVLTRAINAALARTGGRAAHRPLTTQRGAGRRRAHSGAPRSGRLQGSLRIVLMLAVLAAVNYYVLYVRHGTSVPALLKAAEVGRMNSTVPGLSGPPGTPPQVAARVRKPSGREGLPVSYSRALDVALRDEDCEPDALAAALRQRGVAEKLSRTIEETLQQAVQAADIEARPDDTAGLSLYYDQEDLLLSVDYRRSRALAFHLERTTAGSAEVWTAARLTRPLTVQTAVISGILTQEGGLADALQRAGETEGLAGPIADVFGYELDLPAESRSGDRFQVVVEKHLLGGAFYRYGRLLAVQYQGRGGALRAYRFVVPGASSAFRFDPEAGYYNERGESLARSWLRSPVRLGSRGALLLGLDRRRPWPVAHLERRALLGMDYSAPAGTVVRAVASGKVLARSARPAAAGGVTLTVAHGGTEATYGHLGRLARGLVDGAAVRPGQVLGYVGAAPAATPGRAPVTPALRSHLHFAVRVSGKVTDPQKLRPARESAVPAVQQGAFQDAVKGLQGKLSPFPLPTAAPRGPVLARLGTP